MGGGLLQVQADGFVYHSKYTLDVEEYKCAVDRMLLRVFAADVRCRKAGRQRMLYVK